VGDACSQDISASTFRAGPRHRPEHTAGSGASPRQLCLTDKRARRDRHGYVLTQFPSQAMMVSPTRGRPAPFQWLALPRFPAAFARPGRRPVRRHRLFTSELIVAGSGRRLDAEHRATVPTMYSGTKFRHRRGLQSRTGCALLATSAVSCRACARPKPVPQFYDRLFREGSCASCSASRRRRSRTGRTCRPVSRRPRPTSSATHAFSCFRA